MNTSVLVQAADQKDPSKNDPTKKLFRVPQYTSGNPFYLAYYYAPLSEQWFRAPKRRWSAVLGPAKEAAEKEVIAEFEHHRVKKERAKKAEAERSKMRREEKRKGRQSKETPAQREAREARERETPEEYKERRVSAEIVDIVSRE